MVANNILEVYTLIFAWGLYGVVWDVLVGTGLALIPFIVAIILSYREASTKGADAKSIVKAMEVMMFGMLLVLIFCVIPVTGVETNLAGVKYSLSSSDCSTKPNADGDVETPSGDEMSGTAEDNNSVFNGAFDFSNFEDADGSLQIHRPMAWALVNLIATGITTAVVEAMPCANNYELLRVRLNSFSYSDDTQEFRNLFKESCYDPALALWKDNDGVVDDPDNPEADVDWLGSTELMRFYTIISVPNMDRRPYNFHRSEGDIADPRRRLSDSQESSGANPYCYELWYGEDTARYDIGALDALSPGDGLRPLMLAELDDTDAVGSIKEDYENWGFNMTTREGELDPDDPADMQQIDSRLLRAVGGTESGSRLDIGNLGIANDFGDTQFGTETFLQLVQGVVGAKELLAARGTKVYLQTAGPMIVAMIQMLIIVVAPIIMLMGNYRFKTFFDLSLTYFAFEFINAIWAASFWFDQRMHDIFLSSAGESLADTAEWIVLSVGAAAMTFLPVVWLAIIRAAGTSMVMGMGTQGVGGGSSPGGHAPVAMAAMAVREGWGKTKDLGSAGLKGLSNRAANQRAKEATPQKRDPLTNRTESNPLAKPVPRTRMERLKHEADLWRHSPEQIKARNEAQKRTSASSQASKTTASNKSNSQKSKSTKGHRMDTDLMGRRRQPDTDKQPPKGDK